MEDPKKHQPKMWFKIPENFALMSDEEMKVFAQSIWLEMTIKLGEDNEER